MSPRLERARQQFPVTGNCIYLSTGSWGPLSRTFSTRLRQRTLEELGEGRMSRSRRDAIVAATETIRQELAAIVGVAAGDLFLTRSTSASLETVLREFPFARGDNVICTQLEHHACTIPLKEGASKGRFSVTLAQVPEDDADDLRWLESCVTPRTRMIAFTGVSFETGQLLPIRQIAELARSRGIATLLDAAQCVGAMPLDLAAIGIDFCAFPLQKWLCAADGIGGLYVRDAVHERMRRDRMTQMRGVLEASAAHLEWLRTAVGWEAIFDRTQELARYARETFAAIPGLSVLTPEAHAGLVTIEAPRGSAAAMAPKLARRKVVLRAWPELDRYRVSTAFFNTVRELDAVARLFR